MQTESDPAFAPSAASSAPARRPGPRLLTMIGLAVAHAAATFVGTVVVLIWNLTACAGFGYGQLAPMFIGYGLLAVAGLGVWAMLAVRWRRPWIALGGIAAAAPAFWLIAAALAHPEQFCM